MTGSYMGLCDVCNEREQTLGGFISYNGGRAITRTCDECHKLTFEEAVARQQEKINKEKAQKP